MEYIHFMCKSAQKKLSLKRGGRGSTPIYTYNFLSFTTRRQKLISFTVHMKIIFDQQY